MLETLVENNSVQSSLLESYKSEIMLARDFDLSVIDPSHLGDSKKLPMI